MAALRKRAPRKARDLVPSAPKPLSRPMLLRYLDAATLFSVRGMFNVEKWGSGWAVSGGAFVYRTDGGARWRRGPATQWHWRECLFDDLGKAFTLAESLFWEGNPR